MTQDNIQVKIKLLDVCLPVPAYQTAGAAGVDLCATRGGTLDAGQRDTIPTGLCVEIPDGYEGQVRPRSGLARKNGITMLNNPGTIDSDYRGEISVILFNSSNETFSYNKGDRIAQLVFSRVARASFVMASELSNTERGEAGFGSTGVK
ncbi:dUTP diphosphatase [Deferribacterales bacterium RsTz2092]|nr:deoxyuridine 5'-triphosphate nucleotidohydrolase [Deferribacterales bacterium]